MAEVIERVSVSVNGREISAAAIAAEVQNHPSSSADEAWRAAAEALVIRQLLLDEAARLEISGDDLADAEGRAAVGRRAAR